MIRTRALLLALVWALALPGFAADDKPHEPGYWLQRMGPALAKTSYRGVFVFARGDEISSMQIAHRYLNGMVEERLLLQDGKVGEIVRKGLKVICILPEQGRLELNHIIPSLPFAEAYSNQLALASRLYRSDIIGDDRIAGHDVVQLALSARDSFRYSHRLWLEKSTGLPVKGKVLSASGDVLEYFHFTSLTLSDSFPDKAFSIQSEGREVSRTLAPQSPAKPEARTKGWKLGWKPKGFQAMAPPELGNGAVVAFSDGLASFSVFVEPGIGAEMPSGTSRIGATTVYMQRLEKDTEDFLVTVIGEVPLETALRVAESVSIEDSEVLGANLP